MDMPIAYATPYSLTADELDAALAVLARWCAAPTW
jgi:hypothetical protein